MTAKIINLPTAHLPLMKVEGTLDSMLPFIFKGHDKEFADAFKGTLLAAGLPVREKATVIPFRRK